MKAHSSTYGTIQASVSESLPVPSALSLPPVAEWSVLGVLVFLLLRSLLSDSAKDREQDRALQEQLIRELTTKNRERITHVERQQSEIKTLLNILISKISEDSASELLRKHRNYHHHE